MREFADDLVILIDAYKRHDWLMAAVEKRLREELAELQVEINEEKSRIVDLGRGESFGFLGFDFRQVRSLRGAWRAHYTPKLKKRTALLRKLKDMFGRNQSQPVGRVVKLINPVLRGWVNYFAVGHSSECFSFVKDWVEKKIKRHMQRARNRHGLVLQHVADVGVRVRRADGFSDALRAVGRIDMHDRRLRSAPRMRKRFLKPVPMGGGLGQPQATHGLAMGLCSSPSPRGASCAPPGARRGARAEVTIGSARGAALWQAPHPRRVLPHARSFERKTNFRP